MLIKQTVTLFLLFYFGLFSFSWAKEGEGFNFKYFLMHHVKDNHDWHITDIPTGNGKYLSIGIHLPYLVYSSKKGIDFFFLHGHSYEENKKEAAERGYVLSELGHITGAVQPNVTVLDLSLTKTSLQLILIGFLLWFIMGRVAAVYKKAPHKAPSGFQNAVEAIVLFLMDDFIKPNLKGKAYVWAPYMLTLFFMIWLANLLGLTPFNFNVMGDISVTAALASLSFILIQANGSKDYWKHIFWFPGVPVPLKFLMLVVEIIGVFSKAFALAIRLFANIVGGHFMLLSLIGLIFLMYKGGESLLGALSIMPLSIVFGLIIFTLEAVVVAGLQAYIFTLLTSVFIGMAMETHDEHH